MATAHGSRAIAVGYSPDATSVAGRPEFDWKVFEKEEQKRKKLARLQNLAASLNYQLVPNP